jgi:fucose 4-O-acetylase-like acetyltransferase
MTEPSVGKLTVRQPTKRMEWVDYARGIAIILVVYRHTMVGLERSAQDVPAFLYNIQEFLVNVRMPVFFVLSGIFLSRSLLHKSKSELIKKKATSLLYPYILWTVILITMQIFLSTYTNSKRTAADYLYIITQPRELDHMWYLLALFNTSLVLISLSSWMMKYPLIHLLLAALLHFSSILIKDYSLISDVLYYYVFLAVGVQVSGNIADYDKKDNKTITKWFLIALPFFIGGQLFWWYNIEARYEPKHNIYLLPFLLIILVACFVFYCGCRLLYSAGVAKWLNLVGKSSLHIYILHILIISTFRIVFLKIFGITNVYFLIAGSLLLGIALPILVYHLTKKWPPLQYLFTLEKPKH